MSHTIVNLTRRPVSIRLNTGITRHIPPRASLEGLRSGEIDGNARVGKLERRRVIAVREAATAASSRDMSATEAVEHIRRTALEDLGNFIAEGEDRVTVVRALEEKQRS